MNFVIYFILRDFVPVPREQNVALQLVLTLAKFIGGS